mmetsp:Transcript_9764/g.31329  ORF Transcript_9764/g.31329 Transcript_9764/m.31329 type:complete len:303 (+) Transcript_9764:936-1844(+)
MELTQGGISGGGGPPPAFFAAASRAFLRKASIALTSGWSLRGLADGGSSAPSSLGVACGGGGGGGCCCCCGGCGGGVCDCGGGSAGWTRSSSAAREGGRAGSLSSRPRSATRLMSLSARSTSSGSSRASRSLRMSSILRSGEGAGSVMAASAERSGTGDSVTCDVSVIVRFSGGAADPRSAPSSLVSVRFAPRRASSVEGWSLSTRGLLMISMGTEREPRIGASAGPITMMNLWFWWCELRSLIRTFSVELCPAPISSPGLDSSASSNSGTCRFRFFDWLKNPTWIDPDPVSGSTRGSVEAS